jgi:hypothetical protein
MAKISPHPKRHAWAPVEAMLHAAKAHSKQCETKLKGLLDKSDSRLKRLKDPLRANVGLHRWLSEDHEEAYSDWLAWMLEELNKVNTDLLELLGVPAPPGVASLDVAIEREYRITGGRLDLLIRFGQQALLIVEVKVTSADDAQVSKHKVYCQWLKRQEELYHLRGLQPVLLAVDAGEAEYEGFAPLLWEDFCVRVRRMLPKIQHRLGIVTAAMFVAFIGAVEQNLLHLVQPGSQGIGQSLFYARTADHLERSLTT